MTSSAKQPISNNPQPSHAVGVDGGIVSPVTKTQALIALRKHDKLLRQPKSRNDVLLGLMLTKSGEAFGEYEEIAEQLNMAIPAKTLSKMVVELVKADALSKVQVGHQVSIVLQEPYMSVARAPEFIIEQVPVANTHYEMDAGLAQVADLWNKSKASNGLIKFVCTTTIQT